MRPRYTFFFILRRAFSHGIRRDRQLGIVFGARLFLLRAFLPNLLLEIAVLGRACRWPPSADSGGRIPRGAARGDDCVPLGMSLVMMSVLLPGAVAPTSRGAATL